jgi:hypothetical protein
MTGEHRNVPPRLAWVKPGVEVARTLSPQH